MGSIKKMFVFVVVGTMLAGSFLFLQPAQVVFAQGLKESLMQPPLSSVPDEPLPVEGESGRLQQEVLERLFIRETNNHELQERSIIQAEKLVDRIEELISQANENGKDTSALEKAISETRGNIADSQQLFNDVETQIQNHAGFDDSGKVQDAVEAKATLESIREGNKEVRQTLGEGLKIIREAVKIFREANPKPENPI